MVRELGVDGVARSGGEAADGERLGGVDRHEVLVVSGDVAQQAAGGVAIVGWLGARDDGRSHERHEQGEPSNDTSRARLRMDHFSGSRERIRASVQVMSTLSPTFTVPSAALSSTRVEYFQPFGPANEIDGASMSIAVIVAVIVR